MDNDVADTALELWGSVSKGAAGRVVEAAEPHVVRKPDQAGAADRTHRTSEELDVLHHAKLYVQAQRLESGQRRG